MCRHTFKILVNKDTHADRHGKLECTLAHAFASSQECNDRNRLCYSDVKRAVLLSHNLLQCISRFRNFQPSWLARCVLKNYCVCLTITNLLQIAQL